MTTRRAALRTEIVQLATACDLSGLNEQFFLKTTFFDRLSQYVEERERRAYEYGLSKTTKEGTLPLAK